MTGRPRGRGLRRIVATSLALAVLASIAPSPGMAQDAPRPAVVVAPAEISDLRPAARFTGRLVAIQKVDIRARVSGVLERIGFEEGAVVQEGDLLYQIEADAYEAVQRQIEGSIAAAEAERALAEIERQRKARLVERKTVAQSELDVALANVGKAEGEITRLRGQLARARLDVEYARVTAPFSGIAGLSRYDTGAFVGPDSGALTTLTRLDPITVEFPVPTATFLSYRQSGGAQDISDAAAVSMRLPNATRYPLPGRIDYVDTQVSRGTDTMILRAVFENPDALLPDGALVTVSLEGTTPRPVINVPQRAVQRDQVGAFVLVVGGNDEVELRRVEVSQTIDGRSVITEGLDEGEIVITDGINKVRPGIRVDAATGTKGG